MEIHSAHISVGSLVAKIETRGPCGPESLNLIETDHDMLYSMHGSRKFCQRGSNTDNVESPYSSQ